MQAKREREFFVKFDKRFTATNHLEKHKVLNRVVIISFDVICKIFRVIFASKKNQNNTVGILSFHQLGDTVFTIPAVREIFNYYKESKVLIFTYPETKTIYEMEFPADRVIAIDKNGFRFGRRIASKQIKNVIKHHSPGRIFDITGTPASASVVYNSRAQHTIGMNIRYFKNLYTKFTPNRTKPHCMDKYMDVALLITNIDNVHEKFEYPTEITQTGTIMIHPFGIRKAKEWNLNKFIKLALELKKDYDVEMISPPGFLSEDTIIELKELDIPLTITSDIKCLIEKIKESKFFISNDSGPTYIANFLHKPTFTIYGPTNPAYSVPFGKNHRFIQYRLPCSTVDEQYCFTIAGINCPSYECMNLLGVEVVLQNIRDFLNEIGIKKHAQMVS